jgi:uncharacterized cupredoxin-like copper-binding protein
MQGESTMRRSTLLFVLVATALVATACGSPAPAATQAPAPATATLAMPAATEAPATAAASATTVTITLADNTIESSLTTFQVGVPYRFVITNTGRHGHNFNISTPVAVVGSLNDALATALLAVSKDQLGAGASVTVDYTFPDSAAGANLEFSCLIQRHYQDGMLLPITVTK